MAKAQVASVDTLAGTGAVIIRGRAFREGASVWFDVDGNVQKLQTSYVSNTMVIAIMPVGQAVSGAKVAVENRGAEVSRFATVQSVDTGTTEDVVFPGSGVSVPFRLAFIANPFLKENGRIKRDPIMANPAFFSEQASLALHDLFDREPKEFFSETQIRKGFRVSMFFPADTLSMKVKDTPDDLVLCKRRRVASQFKIEASRRRVFAFLERQGTWADVGVVLSGASSSTPTAWFGTDNYARGGQSFEFDNKQYMHAFYSSLQGVIAFSRRPMRPFEFRHEFLHAASAFNSGQILDEYDQSTVFMEPGVDQPFAVNKKQQDPNGPFAVYQQKEYAGRPLGSGSKRRYVPDVAGGHPCIMDRLNPTPRFDGLLRDFMRDRIVARLSRQF